MPPVNLGNVVGLTRGTSAPIKKYILWAHIWDVLYPDETITKRFDIKTNSWIPLDSEVTTFISQTGTPPGSPSVGDSYIVAASGTSGVFSGREKNYAIWLGHNWAFIVPYKGLASRLSSDISAQYIYNGSAWIVVAVTIGMSFTMVSIDGSRTFEIQIDNSGQFIPTEI